MIVKVPPPRRDKQTSFNKLLNYMTEGLPENGADISMTSFQQLTQYITAESALDTMGDAVEKTLAVEIGNLVSLKTAASEMWAVAKQNSLAKDPVYHYILSWPETERPPVKDVLDAARQTIEALGLQEHQYVIAIHVNTDNLHAHIEVNRIHPKTFKSKHIEWAHKTLHKVAREIELKYGWSHDNGLFRVVEAGDKKIVVPNSSYIDPSVVKLSTRANTHETWNGTESFESWCKEYPAKELKVALDKKKLRNWQELHALLAKNGVELKKIGTGFRVINVAAKAGSEDTESAAASRVMRFLKPVELEKAFGEFEAYDAEKTAVTPERTYKRDPIKRFVRLVERREGREDLYQRFQKTKVDIETDRTMQRAAIRSAIKKDLEGALAAHKKKYDAKRAQLKMDNTIDARAKQAHYMLLRLTYAQSMSELREQYAKVLSNMLAELPKHKSWRAWVEEQAKLGDEAAISALRGMTYRDRKDEKDSRSEGSANQIADATPALLAGEENAEDAPTIRPVRQLQWTVTNNGRIIYRFQSKDKREIAFIDEGRRLTYAQRAVSDKALIASLEYAKLKWGSTLTLNGGDSVFRKRVVAAVVKLGMRVKNPELFEIQVQALSELPPQKQGGSRRLTTEQEISRMQKANPNMGFRYAEHTANGAIYTGLVAAITQAHVLQQNGPNSYIAHDLKRLMVIPKVRRNARIAYQNGQATIEQGHPSKKRGR